MYKTLQTSEPSEITILFRFPGRKVIIQRQLRFEKRQKELLMFVYPEGTRRNAPSPVVNIFILDGDCKIINSPVSSIPTPETLINLSILPLFLNKKDASCACYFIKDSIKTGNQHTWYGQFVYPGTGNRHTYFKSNSINKKSATFTTRYIP